MNEGQGHERRACHNPDLNVFDVTPVDRCGFVKIHTLSASNAHAPVRRGDLDTNQSSSSSRRRHRTFHVEHTPGQSDVSDFRQRASIAPGSDVRPARDAAPAAKSDYYSGRTLEDDFTLDGGKPSDLSGPTLLYPSVLTIGWCQ